MWWCGMKSKNDNVVTFKVDQALKRLLEGVPNRSAFIRSAILAATENTCPMCQGSGMLTEHQQKHWKKFTAEHDVDHCKSCKAMHFRSDADKDGSST